MPVSKKKLIFAIPSEAALLSENNSRLLKTNGTQPVGIAKEMIENLTKANYKNVKIYFDAV